MQHGTTFSSTCQRGHRFRGPPPCPVCWPGHRTFTFTAKVWLYPGAAAWHFVTVPVNVSEEIKARFGESARGWGSLPVTVTLGKATWETSIFPDKKAGAYLLPLKADVRKKEDVKAGDNVRMTIEIRL